MKENKKIFAVIGIIIVLFLFMNISKKEATITATRTFSADTVAPGEQLTVIYHPNTMNYMSVIENIPTDWTADKSTSPDGKIRTTADGSDVTIIFTAPSSAGSHIFSGGQYSVFPDTDWTTFSSKTITVGTTQCTPTSWTPSPSTVCSGESFTQTSNCETTKSATGTKDCTGPCTPISWTPSTSTVCDGESFEQTSDCGTTRDLEGTKDCTEEEEEDEEESCEEINDCEIWEECNEKKDGCELAGWVYMVIGFFGFVFLMSMMK